MACLGFLFPAPPSQMPCCPSPLSSLAAFPTTFSLRSPSSPPHAAHRLHLLLLSANSFWFLLIVVYLLPSLFSLPPFALQATGTEPISASVEFLEPRLLCRLCLPTFAAFLERNIYFTCPNKPARMTPASLSPQVPYSPTDFSAFHC